MTSSQGPLGKNERSSARTGGKPESFLTSDMQDIHADRQKASKLSMSKTQLQFTEMSSKRNQEEELINLWITIFRQNHNFHHVIVACPFFPLDFRPTDRDLMRLESLRLGSFLNYPHAERQSTLRLANAGFYYARERFALICQFCGVSIGQDEISPEQDPYALHRARSPNCLIVLGAETGNVFIQDEQRQALSGRDITGEGSEESPVLVHEQVQASRQSMNSAGVQNSSGLMSTGAARSPVSYPASAVSHHVLAVTGATGIATYRHSGEATPPSAAGATAAATTVYDRNLATHKKYTDLQRREQSFLGWPDTHAQSPEELAMAGFFYTGIGDCVRCHYCGLGLKHWDPDDRPLDEHVRWRSSCGYLQSFLGRDIIDRTMARLAQTRRGEAPPRWETLESAVAGLVGESIGVGGQTEASTGADNSITSRETEAEALMTGEAAQSAREMGFPDNLILRSIKALLQTRAGRRAVTPRNVVHAILYLRERGEEPQENPEPAAELVDTEANDEGGTEAQIAAFRTRLTCIVCWDNIADHVLLPCGHIACERCSRSLNGRCHVCRSNIVETIRFLLNVVYASDEDDSEVAIGNEFYHQLHAMQRCAQLSQEFRAIQEEGMGHPPTYLDLVNAAVRLRALLEQRGQALPLDLILRMLTEAGFSMNDFRTEQ